MDIKPHNFQIVSGSKFLFILALGLFLAACGGGSSGSGGAVNTTSPPILSAYDAQTNESDSGVQVLTFDIVLSHSISSDVSVDYATADSTANANDDYIPASGTLIIPAGSSRGSIEVLVNGDVCFEGNEVMLLALSGISSNATLHSADATGVIDNDDQKRQITISDAAIDEGHSGLTDMAFTVSLDSPSCYPTEADFTSNLVTTDALDFTVGSGSILIPAGDMQTTVNIDINGDNDYENDETLSVNLVNISDHIEPVDTDAFGTLRNDDPPLLSIVASSVVEGAAGETGSLVFYFNLEGTTDEVSFDYTTVDGSATIGDSDYNSISGTLVIPAGQLSASISVEVIGDSKAETDESMQLQLSNLTGFVQLQSSSIGGTILDDDTVIIPPSGVTVSYAQVIEGPASTTTDLVFRVSLDAPATSRVTVNYETADGDASEIDDYVASAGSVIIQAGDSEAEIRVTVNGDDTEEADETLALNITSVSGSDLLTPSVTGRIIDDDGPASDPRVNISSASVTEGDSGNTSLVFEVTLTAVAASDVTLNFASADGTALAGSDYVATSGSLNFTAGVTALQIPVTVEGDTLVEAHETFSVELSGLSGPASLRQNSADGTIVTDDPFARISIDDSIVIEGDSGSVDLVFTVSISDIAADPVTMDYETQDVSTDVTDDYTFSAGRLNIPAGSNEAILTVSVNGDTDIENDERLLLVLSNPSANAELGDDSGEGAISNDDGDGGWGAPELLETDADNDGRFPQIAMADNGDGIAIWPQEKPFPTRDEIETRRYINGVGWQAGTEFASDSDNISASNLGQRPRIAVDGNGNAISAWRQSGPAFTLQVVANRYTSATGWGAPVVLYDATRTDNYHIQVGVNDSGQAVVIFLAENIGNTNYDDVWAIKYDPIDGWDAQATQLESNIDTLDTSPRTAIDNDGNIMVVWTRHQVGSCCDRDIYMTRYDAADDVWSTPATVESDIEDAGSPEVALRDDGNAVVLWEQGPAGAQEIWARMFSAGIDDWAGPAESIGTGGSGFGVALNALFNSDGDIFVSWRAIARSSVWPTSAWGARFDAAANSGTGAWDPAQLLELDDVNYIGTADIAVDRLGNAIVVWTQDYTNGDSIYNLRAARFDALLDAWQPAETIEVTGPTNDGHSSEPKVAMDAAGNAIVVWYRQKWNDLWQSYAFGVPDIWTVRYDKP